MKVSREQTLENRDRIIQAAARRLREAGLNGIGVADLMQAAGLTHGGFYRHFKSKNDLVLKAVSHAFAQTREELSGVVAAVGDGGLDALIRRYLSAEHRDNPGEACCLTTLAEDAARHQDPALRAVFTHAVQDYIDSIAALLPDCVGGTKRGRAIELLTSMVGAIVLSRAVNDKSLSDELIGQHVSDAAVRHGGRSHASPPAA